MYIEFNIFNAIKKLLNIISPCSLSQKKKCFNITLRMKIEELKSLVQSDNFSLKNNCILEKIE